MRLSRIGTKIATFLWDGAIASAFYHCPVAPGFLRPAGSDDPSRRAAPIPRPNRKSLWTSPPDIPPGHPDQLAPR